MFQKCHCVLSVLNMYKTECNLPYNCTDVTKHRIPQIRPWTLRHATVELRPWHCSNVPQRGELTSSALFMLKNTHAVGFRKVLNHSPPFDISSIAPAFIIDAMWTLMVTWSLSKCKQQTEPNFMPMQCISHTSVLIHQTHSCLNTNPSCS